MDDESEVNNLVFNFLKDVALVIQACTPTIQKNPRNNIVRDHYGAHDRLVKAYFAEEQLYDDYFFRYDAVRKTGISALVKCTSAVLQLAYDAVSDALDEYLQIGDKTSRDCLMAFCNGVIELYGEDIHCTKWSWAQCPAAYHDQFCKGDSGSEPFILLEAVASQDLWIWHAFFGVAGSNNDINVLRQSLVLNDLKVGKAQEVPFVANDVNYKWGYYLTDRIYPEWVVLIKSISQPDSNDTKRIRYKQAHEALRKDVERAFGVLKKKWAIVRTLARSRIWAWYLDDGTVIGDSEEVVRVLDIIKVSGPGLGLELNIKKTENFGPRIMV
ncbi:ALP1-like protein [Tanacetum coccineum]|uniref:ALP1-like protein n=1 Tax=Tanacetum coccineum TaxID=301880 RepID=A0ABQ4Y1R1_9ASTR